MKFKKIAVHILIAFAFLLLHSGRLYAQTGEMTSIDTVDFIPNDSIVITVKVAFIVNTKGKITRVWVLETECDSTLSDEDCNKKKIRQLEKEAVRVVKGSSPWKPAKHDGELVKAQFVLPVRIVLLRREFLETP